MMSVVIKGLALAGMLWTVTNQSSNLFVQGFFVALAACVYVWADYYQNARLHDEG